MKVESDPSMTSLVAPSMVSLPVNTTKPSESKWVKNQVADITSKGLGTLIQKHMTQQKMGLETIGNIKELPLYYAPRVLVL